MRSRLRTAHLVIPPGDFSFEGDRATQSLGPNNPSSAEVMKPLFALGLAHALITRRRDYRMRVRAIRNIHRFTLLLEGRMTIEMNGVAHEVQPGELVYYSPGTTIFQANPGHSWFLYFTFLDHPTWEPLKKRGAYVRAYESADLMYLLMERIADAYKSRQSVALHLARHEAGMLAELLRHEVRIMALRRRAPAAELHLRRLVDQIKNKPETGWTVASMAAQAHVSTRTLNRLFVSEYGLPPIDMVVRERMTRAYNLLAESDMKIAAIARAVGYQSTASFCRLFKEQVGTSPGECRTNVRVNVSVTENFVPNGFHDRHRSAIEKRLAAGR